MMKMWYFFIILVSTLLIIGGIYILTNVAFNSNVTETELELELEDTPEDDYISYGDFLKAIVLESAGNVDFDLIETNVLHYSAPYLAIAENYDVIEKNTVTEDDLEKSITYLDAIKILALCDINIRHHENNKMESDAINKIQNISKVEKDLLEHAMSIGISEEFLNEDDYLKSSELTSILEVYSNSK